MNREFPGKVQLVRADHYFNLHNEAKDLAFNLSMSPDTQGPEQLLDGTSASLWTASSPGKQALDFDLGADHELTRLVIRHAGDHGMEASLNTRDFVLESSKDGREWRKLKSVQGNQANVTDLDLDPEEGRYLRLRVEAPGSDSIARIADVEIFGKKR
jgi:hypothetical protein